MRSALRVPYSAPQMASASALINVCTNAVSIDRNRSGSACCSCSSTAGTSIGLRLAVIVVITPSGELGGSTKDHCGDRLHQLRHTDQRQAVHHVPGLLSTSVDEPQRPTAQRHPDLFGRSRTGAALPDQLEVAALELRRHLVRRIPRHPNPFPSGFATTNGIRPASRGRACQAFTSSAT